ncbi:carcinoembryonic antigen-related cell adhesion molecule 6-like [Chanos chanos]|uniref:Carcinoembryonic antigen-related cell adhesion molecule 6-like n=1 Tax=Chanos chanos TaxID=29144 RepID=A0A6J2W7Q8_CHACN|nr:carcinoembryonic antigen-related cell adhesion molecule 6-like [Chanos chanos]
MATGALLMPEAVTEAAEVVVGTDTGTYEVLRTGIGVKLRDNWDRNWSRASETTGTGIGPGRKEVSSASKAKGARTGGPEAEELQVAGKEAEDERGCRVELRARRSSGTKEMELKGDRQAKGTLDVRSEPVYCDRVRLDNHTGSLELLNVTVSDSGEYKLSVKKTPEDPELKAKTTLEVLERTSGVSLTGPAQPLIEDQSSAKLTCEGTGSIITTEWMKDGQPLSPSNSIIFSADLRSLSISPVRRSDSGEYQCRLSNPVSSDTATYTMTVNYGPENVSISGQNEVEVGSKVTLTCSAESTPPASFIWMLNGTETGETTASYSIEKINSTHSGNYTCTAWNNVTSLNRTVHHHLTVEEERRSSLEESLLESSVGGLLF